MDSEAGCLPGPVRLSWRAAEKRAEKDSAFNVKEINAQAYIGIPGPDQADASSGMPFFTELLGVYKTGDYKIRLL